MLGKVGRLGAHVFRVKECRHFSAGPIPYFRTPESNPASHEGSHVGRFYTIPEEPYNTLFGTIMPGFPADFRDQCTTFQECCLLVRTPFIDIKNCIEAYDSSLPTLRYILYGKLGAGKTSTLCHLLHYGFNSDYILAHVTWVPLWTRFFKEMQPSITRPGYHDHTTQSIMWLSHFRSQNAALLTKLKLKTGNEYTWSKRETTPAGSNLIEIIEHGIARPLHATECIYALVTELKQLSSAGKCKTMVLLDGVNGFYYDTPKMKDDKRCVISHNKLTLFEAFRQFFKHDWSGGVVACSVDKFALRDEPEMRNSDMPRKLLKKEGWEEFDPFVPIHVDLYSSQEVQTTIDYFLERKWLAHQDAGTKKARKELETLSVRNPFTLRQLCASR